MTRTALVNYIDETSWLMHGERPWLWVMANPTVAYFQIHMNRSKFPILVEVVSCLFKGEKPDLSWITQHASLPVPSTP